MFPGTPRDAPERDPVRCRKPPARDHLRRGVRHRRPAPVERVLPREAAAQGSVAPSGDARRLGQGDHASGGPSAVATGAIAGRRRRAAVNVLVIRLRRRLHDA
jgi:hypothetical protein